MLQALALLIINLTITIAITTDPATSSLTRGIVKLWNVAVLIVIVAYWGNLNGLESHAITDIVHDQHVGSDVKKTLADLPKIEQKNLLRKSWKSCAVNRHYLLAGLQAQLIHYNVVSYD